MSEDKTNKRFFAKGRVVVITAGKYAGKKALLLKSF